LLSGESILCQNASLDPYEFEGGFFYKYSRAKDFNLSLSSYRKRLLVFWKALRRSSLRTLWTFCFSAIKNKYSFVAQVYFPNSSMQVSSGFFPRYGCKRFSDGGILDLSKYKFLLRGRMRKITLQRVLVWIPDAYVDPAGRRGFLSCECFIRFMTNEKKPFFFG